jgi:HSP20 family protein
MKKRHSTKPFNSFNRDEFAWISREMQNIIEDMRFIEMLQKILQREMKFNKQFTHYLNTNILPVWSPKIQEINPRHFNTGDKELKNIVEGEGSIDIMEGEEDVSVTVEIPGVEKKDIDLYLTEESLEITVDGNILNYHRLLNLPCDVDVETVESTYKNGVLDIVVKKKRKWSVN